MRSDLGMDHDLECSNTTWILMVIVLACFYFVDAFIIVESCGRGFQVQCLVVNHSES